MPRRLAPRIAILMFLPALFLAAPHAVGEETSSHVWLISTRAAPRCGSIGSAKEHVRYWRFEDDCRWAESNRRGFLDPSENSLRTTIFVHGYGLNRNEAVSAGWALRRRIESNRADRPNRFVIFSWPSDRVRGSRLRDLRGKAAMCDVQSYYLASCLRDIGPETPVDLVGYSFGARVVTGALHLLAGGQIAGRSLPEVNETEVNRTDGPLVEDGQKPRRRAVLIAPALDADWLAPGRRNGRALEEVRRILIALNPRDPAMKWYSLLDRRRRPVALGFHGPTGGVDLKRVETINVSHSVGREHDWLRYMRTPALKRRLSSFLFSK